MAIVNDEVDAVVVGLGWTGAIMAMELARAGLKVRALERGEDQVSEDFAYPKPADQYGYDKQFKIFAKPATAAVTVRHTTDDTALPTRQWGSFCPGNGVGGAGLHWTAVMLRPSPTDLKLKTYADEAYAPGVLQEDMQLQDFPVTWEEMEPHFDFFEKVCGQSGQAGNINGEIQPGGDPYEGPRSNPMPLPAMEDTLNCTIFRQTATKMGYHPFSNPSANASQAWTNPYGQNIAPCNYCGFCSKYPCLNYSKASPQTTILDALKLHQNFDYRTHAEVFRVDLHDDKKTAKGVSYVDENGEEVYQPAKMVFLCSFQFQNVRLMLLSGIGKPYDPMTGEGVVGRNYAFLSNGGVNMFFKDKEFNPFATAGATGVMFNDVSPRPGFDDGVKYGFLGGAKIHSSQSNGNPIGTTLPSDVPAWGAGWKKGMKEWYGHHMKISITTTCMSYRGNYVDLDPTYSDHLGNPMARITFDWKENELKLQQYLRDVCLKIKDEIGPDSFKESFLKPDSHYDMRPYVSTHNVGGAVMGDDPNTSALNKYLQSWDCHNVFVPGGNAFPQNFQANPTDMIGALTYHAAAEIVKTYINNPGPLVQA